MSDQVLKKTVLGDMKNVRKLNGPCFKSSRKFLERVCALIPLCVAQQSQLYGLQGSGDVYDHFLLKALLTQGATPASSLALRKKL